MYNAKYIEDGLATISKASGKQIIRVNLLNMAERWHREMLPKRFQGNGSAIYWWRMRSKEYVYTVRKMFPNWQPAVRTGVLATSMMNNYRKVVNLRDNRIDVSVNMRRGHATLAYMSKELLRVNQNEVTPLLEQFKDNFISDIAKLPKKTG